MWLVATEDDVSVVAQHVLAWHAGYVSRCDVSGTAALEFICTAVVWLWNFNSTPCLRCREFVALSLCPKIYSLLLLVSEIANVGLTQLYSQAKCFHVFSNHNFHLR